MLSRRTMSWRKSDEETLSQTSNMRTQIRQQFMNQQYSGPSLTSRIGAGNVPNININSSSTNDAFNSSRSNLISCTGATGES